jgi:hypothetical protein
VCRISEVETVHPNPSPLRKAACLGWRLVLAAALVYSPSAAAAENWIPLKGEALKSLLAGKELGDAAHFTYRFGKDGKFSGVELGKDVEGAWRVNANELCWRWTRPRGGEECYEVQRDGAVIRFLLNGSEARYGNLK